MPHTPERAANLAAGLHTPQALPGVFRAPSSSPGSSNWLQNLKAAGWPCRVYRLRFCGVYLLRTLILGRSNPRGLLVCTDVEGVWHAGLHETEGRCDRIMQGLLHARVLRQRPDGCVLIGGLEWDDGMLEQWPQTWLCAPTSAKAEAALNGLHDWLAARYTGKGAA